MTPRKHGAYNGWCRVEGIPLKALDCPACCAVEGWPTKEVEGVGLRDRRRMARSVMWLHLAMKAEQWADELTGRADTDGCGFALAPYEDWSPSDPLRRICIVLDLTPAQLAEVLHDMGQLCEDKADRLGYDEVPEAALG